jgi:hypothetical protein
VADLQSPLDIVVRGRVKDVEAELHGRPPDLAGIPAEERRVTEVAGIVRHGRVHLLSEAGRLRVEDPRMHAPSWLEVGQTYMLTFRTKYA